MTDVLIAGHGAVAQACARILVAHPGVDRVLGLEGRHRVPADVEVVSLAVLESSERPAVLVLAGSDDPSRYVDAALDAHVSVVSVADADDTVRRLLARDDAAREARLSIIAGAGFAPGLSDVLVAHACALFDRVDDVRVARVGTAGDESLATVRRAHRDDAHEWRRGAWRKVARTGPELIWFQAPVGARECEAADIGAVTLHAALPEAAISARVASPPNPWSRFRGADAVGALRVEVWGERNGRRESAVYGATAPIAPATGAVAAITALGVAGVTDVVDRDLVGAFGLGTVVRPTRFLTEVVSTGVTVAVFEGVTPG